MAKKHWEGEGDPRAGEEGTRSLQRPRGEVRVCNFANWGRTWPNGAFLFAHAATKENRDDCTCCVREKQLLQYT